MIARRLGVGYTVGAMVLVEEANSERVLLIRPSYRRGWGLPGGLLRRGEEPAAAARREVREEIGITVDGLHGGAVVFDVLARRIDVVYRGRMAAGCEPTAASAEVREVGWFTPSHLPALLPEARSALSALEQEADGLLVLGPERDSGWLT
jgi:8-oxo-dGTP diphosphatase